MNIYIYIYIYTYQSPKNAKRAAGRRGAGPPRAPPADEGYDQFSY